MYVNVYFMPLEEFFDQKLKNPKEERGGRGLPAGSMYLLPKMSIRSNFAESPVKNHTV